MTNAVLPDPARESSVIAFTSDLRQTTSTALDKVVVALPNPGTDHADFTSWNGNWCPRHETVHSVKDVAREIARYCQSSGGIYSQAYCQNASDPNEVLFYAAVLPEGNCQQVTNPVGVHIIEPKPGKRWSASYLAALHQVGYRTPDEVAAAAQASEIAQRQDRERAERELPLVRTRGTRICKTGAQTTFVGFVEDVSGPKIRISVQQAFYTNLFNIKGLGAQAENYQPQTVWDFPENWRVCE